MSTLDSNELKLPTVQGNIGMEAKSTRYLQYYFKDGSIVFLIEDILYNDHRYLFKRDSPHFPSILGSVQGADGQNPIVLPDVSCSDFDEFLAILYPTPLHPADIDFRRPTEKTTAQWISVLQLTAKWGFNSIQLPPSIASPHPRTPADPLTVEEGLKLGVEDIIRISAARQVYGCANAQYETMHLSDDLGGSADIEEDAIKFLQDQVVTVQAEFATFPTPPAQTPCEWFYGQPLNAICASLGYGPCDFYPGCRAPKVSKFDERRLKREDKEDRERRLNDLKEQHGVKQRDLAEKQERMTLFDRRH